MFTEALSFTGSVGKLLKQQWDISCSLNTITIDGATSVDHEVSKLHPTRENRHVSDWLAGLGAACWRVVMYSNWFTSAGDMQ